MLHSPLYYIQQCSPSSSFQDDVAVFSNGFPQAPDIWSILLGTHRSLRSIILLSKEDNLLFMEHTSFKKKKKANAFVTFCCYYQLFLLFHQEVVNPPEDNIPHQGAVTKQKVAFHMQRENTDFIHPSVVLQPLLGPGLLQKMPLFFSVFCLSPSSS